jgi:hypothetical protein
MSEVLTSTVLNVHVQKRLSRGISITGNYIFSKLMEQDSWLNDTDPRPEKRIGVFDHTHRGVIAVVYSLPFGRNKIFGGWNITGIYTRQSGQPFTFMGTSSTTIGDHVYNGQPLNFNPREVNTVAFNVNAFDRTTANQFAYHLRTFSTTFSNLRGDAVALRVLQRDEPRELSISRIWRRRIQPLG